MQLLAGLELRDGVTKVALHVVGKLVEVLEATGGLVSIAVQPSLLHLGLEPLQGGITE
jgi:hypothetical protein